MRVDNSVGKGKSGMDKFGSVIDSMNSANEHEAWKQVSKLFESHDPAPQNAPVYM